VDNTIDKLEEFNEKKVVNGSCNCCGFRRGKTTIASHLKGKLSNSKAIYFDDYDFDAPEDIIEWIDNGCNPDDWNLSPLIRDIKKCLTEPLDYVILDFPFAYLHSKTSKLIDFAVFIDTPLDIACHAE
jgi:uridine kinase